MKKLYIKLEDEARFEPGVANALKAAFMKDGIADGRSVTIEKGCTFPHREFDEEDLCPGCGNTKEDLNNRIGNWEYKDDMLSYQAVENSICLGGKLKKGKPTKGKPTTGKTNQGEGNQDESYSHEAYRESQTDQSEAGKGFFLKGSLTGGTSEQCI